MTTGPPYRPVVQIISNISKVLVKSWSTTYFSDRLEKAKATLSNKVPLFWRLFNQNMPDGTLFCPNVTPEGFFSSLSVHTQLRSAQIKTWFGHSFSRYYLQLYLMWYRQGLSQWRALWIGNVALLNKTYFELWIQSLTPAFSFYAVFSFNVSTYLPPV